MKFLFLLLALCFLSVISLNYVYAETPFISVNLEKDHYSFGQKILLNIDVKNGKINNSIDIQVYDPENNIVFDYSTGKSLNPITKMTFPITATSKWIMNGQYNVKITYLENSISYSDSISFFFDPASNLINYFPARSDIGTNWLIQDINSNSIDVLGFQDGLCQKYQPYYTVNGLLNVCIFRFDSSTEISKTFQEWKSDAIKEGGFETMKTDSINADNCIGKLLPTAPHAKAESELLCQKNNFYFHLYAYHLLTFQKQWEGSESDILNFAEIMAKKIPKSSSNQEIKNEITKNNNSKLAPFVDPTKDLQSYIDRYNNEPSYKKWFDENYPQYSSIEEAVGLKMTAKIPSWVKNIFGWYAQDQVSEDELLNAIKYLINEKILIVN